VIEEMSEERSTVYTW